MQFARPGRPQGSAPWTAPRGGKPKAAAAGPPGRTDGRGNVASARAKAPRCSSPAAPRPPAAGSKAACQGQATGRRSGGLGTRQGPSTPTVLLSRVRAPRLYRSAPLGAALPSTVLSLTASVPEAPLKMPPPSEPAVLL